MGLKQLLKKNRLLVEFVCKSRSARQKYAGLNWFKTLYINFKTQKFYDARKLPIYIYGKVKIYNLNGRFIIDSPIRSGMIKLGLNTDKFSASKGSAMLCIAGEIIFKGDFLASVDYALDVSGQLIIGEMVGFGNGVRVRCWNSMHIGKGCRIGVDTQIFDTNFHYTRNIETGRISPMFARVELGNYCWIGNRVTIMKGTMIPCYSIVAGGSLLNKDYTKDAPLAPTLAGVPAKIISSGTVRLFDTAQEAKINMFFNENPEAEYYPGEQLGIIDEGDGIKEFFKSL